MNALAMHFPRLHVTHGYFQFPQIFMRGSRQGKPVGLRNPGIDIRKKILEKRQLPRHVKRRDGMKREKEPSFSRQALQVRQAALRHWFARIKTGWKRVRKA